MMPIKATQKNNLKESHNGKLIRTTEDLELLRLILENNPSLKARVMHFIQTSLDIKENKDLRQKDNY